MDMNRNKHKILVVDEVSTNRDSNRMQRCLAYTSVRKHIWEVRRRLCLNHQVTVCDDLHVVGESNV